MKKSSDHNLLLRKRRGLKMKANLVLA